MPLLKKQTKLSRAEKKELAAIMVRHNASNGKEKSAQDSIPYERLYPDGICKVEGDFYSKTILFEDINYQLAENEDKTAIFDGWCDFLNYFDPQINFQLSFLNLMGNEKTFEDSITIKEQDDAFNGIRREYSEMLLSQLSKGNNGILKRKYLTFGTNAKNYKKAKPRLERIESEVKSNLKRLGVRMESLDGKARLNLFHNMIHMDDNQSFHFDWKWLVPTGLSTKDFIAPSSFYFGDAKMYKTGNRVGTVSFLHILAPEISDRILADFLEIDGNQSITIHVKSIDHIKAVKMVKAKLTDLERIKIDEQKKAVRSGYDMDILSSDLALYITDVKKLLQDLQSRNERLFYFTLMISHTDVTKDKLDNTVFAATSLAQKMGCVLYRLDYQQEEGFMSMLPLAKNRIDINRSINTTGTAGFMPFTTSELFQKGDGALYYGINAISNNLLMADRKLLKNPNGLILGTPGSGKSFSAKREIVNVFLITNDDIAILDPENEYSALVEILEGQVIKISPLSTQYINPMDINIENSENENPLILKSDFILSLFEIMMGKVEADEKSIIDRCLQLVYMPYMADPINTPMPILEDLYNKVIEYGGEKAKHIADCMQIYVTGSLNVFNHRTNVDVHNRVVCYDTKELGNALKEFGMLVVQDQIWSRVSKNRDNRKSTRYYIDEMHLLLGKEQTANYTVEIWKRFRKWGGIPTGLTQNVKDFLCSPQVANIFENSDFVYLLNQAGGDREILAKQLNISPHQLSYVTNSGAGEGLLIYGSIIIPFVDHFPRDTELYRIMTTKLDETVSGDVK
ncbi:conjugal transfer protein TraE [Bengtsoniella intestinalis]|uniref:VirB4-like conjugal transfer ATPase, CD1110 family n=1 Tax=Bengtsoniella intestinalis TaxID=3073143 RepID=UPI00391F5356